MGLGDKLKDAIGNDRVENLQQQLHDIIDQGLERHLRIAVTGLSRSGKTVFISALTHHLLHSHRSSALPFLDASSEGRIISVKEVSTKDDKPFPLQQSIQQLQQNPPQWPLSSTGLSTVRLAIKYRPKNRLRQLLSDTSTLFIDIIDYPGEWLLDLPLLTMDYSQWCQSQLALLQQAPRNTDAAKWLAATEEINWQQPVSAETIDILNSNYKALLAGFREQGLSLLQPGRWVLPDSDDGPSLFPIPAQDNKDTKSPSGSGLATLEQHYNDYVGRYVKPFYRQHFSRFDRQIVLVDCLKTLNLGKHCFDDMQLALTTVLESFNYGQSSFIRRLISPRIDKVLFAATKADHVTANQHHNLDLFLQLIIDKAQRGLRFDGIETRCLAIASIRSTESATARVNDQQLSCLKGLNKTDGEEVAIFPGEVPIELPDEAEWSKERFRFIDFAPKRLPQQNLSSEHHIRLDQALEFLIGDYL